MCQPRLLLLTQPLMNSPQEEEEQGTAPTTTELRSTCWNEGIKSSDIFAKQTDDVGGEHEAVSGGAAVGSGRVRPVQLGVSPVATFFLFVCIVRF